MKKIQLFASPTIISLQLKINDWLAENKDTDIIETNITALAKVSVLGSDNETEGQYAFYVLYNSSGEGEENVLTASKQMPSELIEAGIINKETN